MSDFVVVASLLLCSQIYYFIFVAVLATLPWCTVRAMMSGWRYARSYRKLPAGNYGGTFGIIQEDKRDIATGANKITQWALDLAQVHGANFQRVASRKRGSAHDNSKFPAVP